MIGIKREQGAQTFERVHVGANGHLIESARSGEGRRFVQISVIRCHPDPTSPYHDTKWRAEELVRNCGLPWTILRPGVIYGPGDDMVKMIRFAPIFPVMDRGDSLLQPVHAGDVAAAAAGALANDRVGRQGVRRRRARASEPARGGRDGRARSRAAPAQRGYPLWFQRAAVGAMNAAFRNPLSTPAQLRMLIDGLYGDPEPARRDLAVEPRPFTADEVRTLAGPIPSRFGVSLRRAGRGAGAPADQDGGVSGHEPGRRGSSPPGSAN